MADALSILREYTIGKKSIEEHDGHIIFGDFSWPKDVKTNYVVYGTGKDGNPKDYYTLETLLFLIKNVKLSHPLYVRTTHAENIAPVRRPDRKDVLAYLNGDIATSNNIDKSAPLDITLQRPSKVKRPAAAQITSAAPDDGGITETKRSRLDEVQKPRNSQRLDQWLDGNHVEKPVSAVIPQSLEDAYTHDELASIKAKILARKRKAIQPTEPTDLGPLKNGAAKLPEITSDISMDIESGTYDMTTEILLRERNWRTRSTILQTGKSFSKNVFALLSSIKAKEEGRNNPDKELEKHVANLASARSNTTSAIRKPASQAPGYSRYDQERFRGKEETLGFRIDTMGSYHDMSLKSVMEGAASKKIPAALKPKSAIKPSRQVAEKPSKPAKRVSRTPIIIIPAATTSLITLYNAKDLLQDFKYFSTSQKKAAGVRRDNEVLIQRRKDNGAATVPYRVIDNISKLQTHEEWDRVVAVFVQGPAWQFKGWPWLLPDGSPVDIFAKIQAFHVKFVEQKLESNVGKWNVHILNVSEHKRHMDRAVLGKFWEVLDRYMLKNKPHLRH